MHTILVDNIIHKTDDDLNLKGSIQKFWGVENVGVDEYPVYENFKQTISFDGERDITALPFKPFHKPLPDNYILSKHQLIDNYLKDGLIEKVADDDYGVVEKIHYLPHQAVVRCN